MKEEGSPLSRVLESIQETAKVIRIPNKITKVSMASLSRLFFRPIPKPTKNMVISERMVGKRPLQGTRELVSMAIRRSRLESMMRQPMTPAALHPNPMHIVRACFPQAQHFLKCRSRLNATLGR